MKQYVTDTHPLLWYVSADAQIGSKAKVIIEKAEAGEINIIVPAIVLIEAIDVLNKKRIIYNIGDFFQWIDQIPHHEIKNLDLDIINLYKDYLSPLPSVKLKSHDKIIVVTAQFFNNLPIITKDPDIQKVYPTIW
ncbi:MAG: hypothetical protein COZ37_07060 [bacterium (Candidatus Ratteibacteria) CG_4_10_14_3_um_filter_41_18]|uniref:PIN domain-containing protein n=4 Tax=Candidatus Ratteibacteria TaxID=2979319 RepID=A0A2M7E9P5_9BACT|nr:MAG: hypothetical protein COS11_02055 [bacterium (Candidatus Ratteibacteria) CG01_land_8_20_14_3_00_40_19]PIW33676.1 MAG: hypothetical protein COW28_03310 [bacterium (Candidatus Ratteibacteria) CG15_BIG_FIL_POST_REV_8_21_14_020_41_12]PIX76593.1 MAG: hypothetical protein COZ37_07060 [bacterium (Candidatus Ratteibacteria) CG_4_10_14_3_um_filter_41_18]PJA62315.1 MAG: hypothetical protein CO162_01740 [bacterium (Candidatus Ratteibacteria) CG_4_9_14_3_um_filter_41_21]